MTENPYVADIRSQADGLRRILGANIVGSVEAIAASSYDRIVLSGMGASLFALYPAWLAGARAGLPAWWIETGELLHDAQGLITDRTLLLLLLSPAGARRRRFAPCPGCPPPRPRAWRDQRAGKPSRQGADVVVPIIRKRIYGQHPKLYQFNLVTRIVAGAIVGHSDDIGQIERAAQALILSRPRAGSARWRVPRGIGRPDNRRSFWGVARRWGQPGRAPW